MVIRPTALAAASCLLLMAGCDEGYTPPAGTPATPATAAAGVPSASSVSTAERTRISLGAIPFSVEVPQGWGVQAGVTNRIVLHGKAPSGEVDVLLGTGPNIKAEDMPMLIKASAKPSSDPHVKNEVAVRDNLTLVKTIAPQLAPGAVANPDPELVPMGWTVQVIVSDGKVDYSAYDLTFVGLSQAMFDKDEAFFQKIIDSLKYESAATRPAMP